MGDLSGGGFDLLGGFNGDSLLMDLISSEDLAQLESDRLPDYPGNMIPPPALPMSPVSPHTGAPRSVPQSASATSLGLNDPQSLALIYALANKVEMSDAQQQQLQQQQQQQQPRQQQVQADPLADSNSQLTLDSLLSSLANQTRQSAQAMRTSVAPSTSSPIVFSSIGTQPMNVLPPQQQQQQGMPSGPSSLPQFSGSLPSSPLTQSSLSHRQSASQTSEALLQRLLQLQQAQQVQASYSQLGRSPGMGDGIGSMTQHMGLQGTTLGMLTSHNQQQVDAATAARLGTQPSLADRGQRSSHPRLPPLQPLSLAAQQLSGVRTSANPPSQLGASPAMMNSLLQSLTPAGSATLPNGFMPPINNSMASMHSPPLSGTMLDGSGVSVKAKVESPMGASASLGGSPDSHSGSAHSISDPIPSVLAGQQQQSPTSDEMGSSFDQFDMEMDDDDAPRPGKPKAKTKRKSCHNNIERKYRRSINDRIFQLQKRFADPAQGKNLSKSGVLQKVLDYLEKVDTENAALKENNDSLRQSHKMALNQLTHLQSQLGLHHSVTSTQRSMVRSPNPELQQLGVSHPSDGAPSPVSSASSGIVPDYGSPSPNVSSLPSSPSDQATTMPGKPKFNRATQGIAESSKPLYCFVLMFMATVVAGPFSVFSDPGQGVEVMHAGGTGRTLLHYVGVPAESHSTISYFAGCVMQLTFMILGLAWVLIHGEPFVGPGSSEHVQFYRYRQQVDAYIANSAYGQAVTQLEECLQVIGRRLPLSRVNIYCSLVWQLMHSVLLLSGVSYIVLSAVSFVRYVLRLDSRQGGQLEMATRKSACQAALVYHHLNCLSLTGHASYTPAVSLYIALCSFNLAKSAGSTLDRAQLAEIYATVAVRLHSSLPTFIPKWPFSRILLRRARSVCHPPPPMLRCLLHPDCRKLLDSVSEPAQPLWSQPTTPGRPMSAISSKLSHHLLRQTLHQLLVAHHQTMSGDPSSLHVGTVYEELPQQTVATIEANLATLCQLCHVGTCALSASAVGHVKSDVDRVSLWWFQVVTIATRWLGNQEAQAAELYSSVIHQPEGLAKSKDPLPAAVLRCFIARRAYLKDANDTHVLELCKVASGSLSESIAGNKSFRPGPLEIPSTHQLLQLLCCDWLLSTRVGAWQAKRQSTCGQAKAAALDLSAFQRDLTLLQKLSYTCPIGLSQVFVYEAVARLMAGANPQHTHYLLAKGTKLTAPPATKA